MSAQQIKLTINDLVNRIEDEDKLQACFVVLATIANDDKKQHKPKAVKPRVSKKNKVTLSSLNGTEQATVRHQENVVPHDLSLVLLANDLFKNSQALPEAGILAFDDVLRASALKIPTLPNRL
jgi:hypothetical protein